MKEPKRTDINEVAENLVVDPHEFLSDSIGGLGMTKAEFGRRAGIDRSTLSGLCYGQRKITPRIALKLEGVTTLSAERWVAMQASWDVASERDGPPKTHF